MLSQTKPINSLPSFETSDTSLDQLHKIANQVQIELDIGDFLAIELQKSLNGLELFVSSPLNLQAATFYQVQLDVEPYVELYQLLIIINNRSVRHTCLVCKSNDNVVKNGHIQRKCKNEHDQTDSEYGVKYFNGSTSLEGQKATLILGNFVSQQLYGNSTHDFISQLLGVSTYFV